MSTVVAASIGVAADRALGEPPSRLHPVAWFGAVMRRIEISLHADRRGPGVAYTAIGVGLGLGVGLMAQRMLGRTIATVVAMCLTCSLCALFCSYDSSGLPVGPRRGECVLHLPDHEV